MKFEERVTVLCAQALVAHDEAEVRELLTELRILLHRHIQHLRTGLLAAYSATLTHSDLLNEPAQPGTTRPSGSVTTQPGKEILPRTWQQVVHDIADEPDHNKALQLSEELSDILRNRVGPSGQC